MTGHHFVLVVDNDADVRRELAEHIHREPSLDVIEATALSEARQKVTAGDMRVDALLLDEALPDGDSVEFCMELRQRKIKIPILMMTTSQEEEVIVTGLDAGANDYVIKPLRARELMARLRAQLRTFENSEDVMLDVGPYIFRPAHKQLVDPGRGRRIHLTEKETSILKYLYRVGHKSVSREVLLNEVWGYNAGVTTHTLETHIYRLRQKIEPNAQRNALVVTEGGGYRLNAYAPASEHR